MSCKVKLTGIFEKHFPKINEYKVVFICDDSGSMAEELSYKEGCSRWDELIINYNRFFTSWYL